MRKTRLRKMKYVNRSLIVLSFEVNHVFEYYPSSLPKTPLLSSSLQMLQERKQASSDCVYHFSGSVLYFSANTSLDINPSFFAKLP